LAQQQMRSCDSLSLFVRRHSGFALRHQREFDLDPLPERPPISHVRACQSRRAHVFEFRLQRRIALPQDRIRVEAFHKRIANLNGRTLFHCSSSNSAEAIVAREYHHALFLLQHMNGISDAFSFT